MTNSGAVEYIGDLGFEESEEPQFTIDDYGADEMVRTFLGRSDLLKEFLRGWKKKVADTEFPQLSVTNRSCASWCPGMVQVKLIFKGLLDDDLPDPMVEGGWVTETSQVGLITGFGSFAQLGHIDLGLGNRGGSTGATGINMNLRLVVPGAGRDYTLRELAELEAAEVAITYRSPMTQFRYVTRKEPKKPLYSNVLLVSDGDFEISDVRPAIFAGRPVLNREIKTIEFRKARIGRYWEVSEATQGFLVSSKVAMRGVIGRFRVTGKKPHTLNIT